MTTIKLKAMAYRTPTHGKHLLLCSNKTGVEITLHDKWFDAKILDLYHRVMLEQNDANYVAVEVPFSQEELNHLWATYKQQQRDKKKRLLPAKD